MSGEFLVLGKLLATSLSFKMFPSRFLLCAFVDSILSVFWGVLQQGDMHVSLVFLSVYLHVRG